MICSGLKNVKFTTDTLLTIATSRGNNRGSSLQLALSCDCAAETCLSSAARFQQFDLAFLLTEKQASFLVFKIVRADQQLVCFKSAVAGSRVPVDRVVEHDEITL